MVQSQSNEENTEVFVNGESKDNGSLNAKDLNKDCYGKSGSTADVLAEIARIYDRTISLAKSVDSFSHNNVDVESILTDIETQEENFFSAIPDYIQKEWKQSKSGNPDTIKGISKVDTVGVFNEGRSGRARYDEKSRIVIDPQVPLPMPFNKQRFDATDERKKNVQGNYHTLFFDEGEPLVFTAPEGNKRQQIEKAAEEVAMWKKKMQRPEREVEKPAKKPLKVTGDFVPSCAQVDSSSAREKLQQRQEAAKVNGIKRHRFISN